MFYHFYQHFHLSFIVELYGSRLSPLHSSQGIAYGTDCIDGINLLDAGNHYRKILDSLPSFLHCVFEVNFFPCSFGTNEKFQKLTDFRWSARHYIIPIVSFSFLYNSPKFFELETRVTSNAMNQTVYAIEPTSMRVNQYYIQIYCIWMNFVFMGLGPFVMLIVLNLFTLKDLSGIKM